MSNLSKRVRCESFAQNLRSLLLTCPERADTLAFCPMGKYKAALNRMGWLLLGLAWLGMLSACDTLTPASEATGLVVTQVVDVAGEQIVITRVLPALPTPTPTPPPPATLARLVTLDLGYTGELPNLDPHTAGSRTSLDVIESLFVGLTNYNHETGEIEPELATGWTVSADGRVWTFTLRDDVAWVRPALPAREAGQIGSVEALRPVVPEDVVYAVQRACTRATAVPEVFTLFVIEGCEQIYNAATVTAAELERLGVQAVDSTTLRITLTRPASYLPTLTSMAFFRPLPRELVEELGARWQTQAGNWAGGWQTPANLVTSGPFVPVANRMDKTGVTLQRNPLWSLPRRGNVDVINIQFLRDERAIYDLWEEKALDTAPLPSDVRQEFLLRTPAKALLATDLTVFYLSFNFNSPVFREPEVRRAFGAAINRELLVEELYGGRGIGLRHFSPPGAFGAPPVDEVGVGYSPDFARQQMAGSGFRACALLPPITLLVSSTDLSLDQAEVIRQMWVDELGCDESLIEIAQVQFGRLLADTRADAGGARPDVWELAWAPYYPDAHDFLSDLLHCEDSENRQNRPCSEADDLLRQARVTPDPEVRRSLYRRVENLFFGENGSFPVIPLYIRGRYVAIQSWIAFTPARFGGEQFDAYIIVEELKRLERSRQ